MSNVNPFRERSEQENTQKDKEKRAIESANETMKKARACINTKQFKEYKEQYKKTREQIFDICESLKSKDATTYAFEISNYMNTLRVLGALLKKVETEARTNEQ